MMDSRRRMSREVLHRGNALNALEADFEVGAADADLDS